MKLAIWLCTLLLGSGALAETISASLTYTSRIGGGPRPLINARVEIITVPAFGPPRIVYTDASGRFSVNHVVLSDAPSPINSHAPVKYSLRVYAWNSGARLLWPPGLAPGFGGRPLSSALSGDVYSEPPSQTSWKNATTLRFDADVGADLSGYFQVADAVQRGRTYADSRRDPAERDAIPVVLVQPHLAPGAPTFYDPVLRRMNLSSTVLSDDFTVLHEYAYALEHAIGKYLPTLTVRDRCLVRTVPGGPIINTEQQAWRDGFAAYFARAVETSLPAGTLRGSSSGTLPRNLLETPEVCPPAVTPTGVVITPAMRHGVVAGALFDLMDDVSPAEADFMPRNDRTVFEIFDRELDLPHPPTLHDFHEAWARRGMDDGAFDRILTRIGVGATDEEAREIHVDSARDRGRPAVHSGGRGVVLFARTDRDRLVMHDGALNPTTAIEPYMSLTLDGSIFSQPAVLYRDPTTFVFFRGADNFLKLLRRNTRGSLPLQSLGVAASSSPAAAFDPDGHLAVFVRTPAMKMARLILTSAGVELSRAEDGGFFRSAPSVAASMNGRMAAVAVGKDNEVRISFRGAGGAWSTFRSFGAVVTSIPMVVSNAQGRFEFFVRGTDGNLWRSAEVAPEQLGAWTRLPSLPALSSPLVMPVAGGGMQIFVRSTFGTALLVQTALGEFLPWRTLLGPFSGSGPVGAHDSASAKLFVLDINNVIFKADAILSLNPPRWRPITGINPSHEFADLH